MDFLAQIAHSFPIVFRVSFILSFSLEKSNPSVLLYLYMAIITIFSLLVLFFSVVVHEVSHGAMAYFLGDSTAKQAGRLSLNPLKHIDIFGSIIVPLSLLLMTMGRGPLFGWAKPVPINPFNFKDQRWGQLKVALAGPLSNFLLALIFGLICRFLPLAGGLKFSIVFSFFTNSQEVLIPSLQASPYGPLFLIFSVISIYNIAWGIFNLLPLPPLDGSHILFSFLSRRFDGLKMFLAQYGTLILLFLIFFGVSWIFTFALAVYQFMAIG